MAYWIQEVSSGGSNRSGWRMYHCDYVTDIANLPLNDREGVQQGNDTIGCTKAHFGATNNC